ncbi:MAG: dihydrolipoyl dehydrogenase [Candidatus Hodarchaeales archaeon]
MVVMSGTHACDILIIGAGPGGYVAAIRASQLGANVILIDNNDLGGTCLNRGCIPTKALVETIKRYHILNGASKFGLRADNIGFDYQKIQKRKNQIVKRLVKGIQFLLKQNKITVINGTASFVEPKLVKIITSDGETFVSAKNVIIATGGKPFKVPIPGLDSKRVLTSKELLELDYIPKSMVIIGGGVIGDEFACIFNTLGTKVTIIEMLPNLIPMEDKELGLELEAAFKRSGIQVFTKSRVTKVEDLDDNQKLVRFIDPEGNDRSIEAEYVLLSVGRTPAIEGLNLEAVPNLKFERGIIVDPYMKTSVEGIYAIGDVIQGQPSPMLAYTASHEGEVAVENALGYKTKMDYHGIPSTIFTNPEVASVGLTEEKAKESYTDILIGKFPFQGNSRAVISGENRGFVKVIVNKKNHEILGMHIIGPHATDLISEGVILVANRMKAEDIIHIEHAHPVFYEIIKEAVLDALGRAIHK